MVDLTRRELLFAAALVAVTGAACTSQDAAMVPSAGASGSSLDDTAASERSLIALYDATLAAYPDLRGELGYLREQHLSHLAALGLAAEPLPAAPRPGSPSAARTALIRAERTAGRARRDAAVSASDAGQVRLLALIAASEASHASAIKAGGAA